MEGEAPTEGEVSAPDNEEPEASTGGWFDASPEQGETEDGSTGFTTLDPPATSTGGPGDPADTVPCAGTIVDTYSHEQCIDHVWVLYTYEYWECDDGRFIDVVDATESTEACEPSFGCVTASDCYSCCDAATADEAQLTDCYAQC